MDTLYARIFFSLVAIGMACRFMGRLCYIKKINITEDYVIDRLRFLDFTEVIGMRKDPGWFGGEVFRCPNALIGIDAVWALGYLWLLHQQKLGVFLVFLIFFMLVDANIEFAKDEILSIRTFSSRKGVWRSILKKYFFYGLLYVAMGLLSKP